MGPFVVWSSLRQLLARPHPYDSVLCSSTAARDALRKLLDGCAERFNRAQGTDLAYRGRLDVIPLGVDLQRFRPRDRQRLLEGVTEVTVADADVHPADLLCLHHASQQLLADPRQDCVC